MEEWLDLSHAVALACGVVAGLLLGFMLFRRKGAGQPAETTSESPRRRPPVPTANVVTKETFTAYISRVDVERGMTIPLAHHLSDVVQEANETDGFGHQLKLVFIGFDKGPPPEENPDLLKHLVLVHQRSPHLAFWLNDESLQTYLKLLHLALQMESADSISVSWYGILDEIGKHAPEAIARDLGEERREGIENELTDQGMERVRGLIAILEGQLHPPTPMESSPGKRGSSGIFKKPK